MKNLKILFIINIVFFSFNFLAMGQLSPIEKEYYWKSSSKKKTQRPPFKTYQINEWDKQIPQELIFNSPFNIKLKMIDSTELGEIGVFLVKGNSEFIHSGKKSEFEGRYGNFKISKNILEKKTFYFDIPPLIPHKEYSFIIPQHLPKKSLDELHNFNHKLSFEVNRLLKKSTHSRGKAEDALDLKKTEIIQDALLKDKSFRKEFKKIIQKQNKSILSKQTYDSLQVTKLLKLNNFNLFTYEEYIVFFLKDLNDLYAKIQKEYCTDVICETVDEFIEKIDVAHLDTFVELSYKLIKENKANDDVIDIVSKLVDIKKNDNLKYLLLGDISLDFILNRITASKTPKINHAKKEINIKKTISSIMKVVSFSKTINTSFSNPLDSIQFLRVSREVIKQETAIEENYQDANKVLKDNLNRIFQLKIFYGSTLPNKFSDGIKNIIKADLGFQYFFAPTHSDSIGTGQSSGNFRPYFGLLVHPWGLNDNLPSKMQPIKSKIFFQAGFTLGSIKVNGKRDNFFSKSNLLVGTGYSINRTFHVSIGSILFKKINNIEGSDFTNTSLGLAPYFSIGIHPDISSIASSLTGLIFK